MNTTKLAALLTLLVLSPSFAQLSHPLSEIVIESNLDMETRQVSNAGTSLNLTDPNSRVHFYSNSEGEGFGIKLNGASDTLQFSELYGNKGQIFRLLRNPSGSEPFLNVSHGLLWVDKTNNRVGVGTSSPSHRLHLSGGDVQMDLGRGLSFEGSTLGRDAARIYTQSGSYEVFVRSEDVSGVAKFTGYGLSLPKTNQDYGLIAAGSLKMGNALDANLTIGSQLQISSDGVSFIKGGDVGVGTKNPVTKLEVQGNVKSVVGSTEFYMVPQGAIVMWSGSVGDIPDGWALCDGSLSTPDMTDRFVKGAGPGEDPGGSGGQNTLTLNTSHVPSHDHAATTELGGRHDHNDVASVGLAGEHGHSGETKGVSNHRHTGYTSFNYHTHDLHVIDYFPGTTDCMDEDTSDPYPKTSDPTSGAGSHKHADKSTGGAGKHTHTISGSLVSDHDGHSHSLTTSSSGAHSHGGFSTTSVGSGSSFDKRPEYYKLAFIMKL